MALLREKILKTLKPGVAMKKAEVLHSAKLPDDDATRVGNILAKLKDEGLVTMQGTRGSAIYTRTEKTDKSA